MAAEREAPQRRRGNPWGIGFIGHALYQDVGNLELAFGLRQLAFGQGIVR